MSGNIQELPKPTATPRLRCDGCRFWVKIEGSYEGRCQRFPPVPYNAIHSRFPEARQDAWCGEHQPRPVAEPIAPPVPAKGASGPATGKRGR